jgi:Zn-dependent protease with chaperone function
MPNYPGISSEAFRHPLDQEAELALRSVPGFDIVARKFIEFIYERPQFVYLMGNAIEVGPRQYSTVYQIFRECVACLDISPTPDLFVTQNPVANSYSLGEEKPYVVIYSGLLDLLNEAEIRAVLTHELGHIKCGHTTLTQMAIWVMNAASILGELTFGLGSFISSGLIFAFYEWRRKAELSADRAALLGTDDLNTVLNTMMKLSGGSHQYVHELNLNDFIRQSEAYQQLDEDGLNQIYKLLMYNGAQGMILSHPFPVERVTYLQAWESSEAYQRIRQGDYSRTTAGAVDVESHEPMSEAERLRREVERLQAEIAKRQSKA